MISFLSVAWVVISRVWGSLSVAGCVMFKIAVILVSLGFSSQIEKLGAFSCFFGEALWFCLLMLGNLF
jgi:hypothetical protein